MSTALKRRLADLETEFWSKAKHIEIPGYEEYWKFFFAAYPISIAITNQWFEGNMEVQRLSNQIESMEKALSPINPAFLKSEDENYRHMQWGLHTKPEYRRATEDYWLMCYEHLKANYELKNPDLLAIAIRFWEKDIDRWQAQFEYISVQPYSREQHASDQIDLWRRVRKICDEEGEDRDESATVERWNRVFIEHNLEFYGREITAEELDFERKVWNELREDMEDGRPASESAAAQYLHDIETRYPRIAGAI
jgi:hypothetical protein